MLTYAAGHIVLSGCREDLILEILGLAHQAEDLT